NSVVAETEMRAIRAIPEDTAEAAGDLVAHDIHRHRRRSGPRRNGDSPVVRGEVRVGDAITEDINGGTAPVLRVDRNGGTGHAGVRVRPGHHVALDGRGCRRTKGTSGPGDLYCGAIALEDVVPHENRTVGMEQ